MRVAQLLANVWQGLCIVVHGHGRRQPSSRSPRPQATGTSGAVLCSDDYGLSAEPTATLPALWRACNTEIAAEQEGKVCLGVRSPGYGFGDAEASGLSPVLPPGRRWWCGASRAWARRPCWTTWWSRRRAVEWHASPVPVGDRAGVRRVAPVVRRCRTTWSVFRVPARCADRPKLMPPAAEGSMPGSEGRAAGGTWTQWPLATAGPGGMLTAPASRHRARQPDHGRTNDQPTERRLPISQVAAQPGGDGVRWRVS